MMPRTRRLVLSLALMLVTLAGSGPADAAPFQVRERRPDVSRETLSRLSALPASGGAVKVWVYFTDKDVLDADTYASRLDEVATRLDPHAAERRAKVFGDRLVDFHDIPVHEGYVAGLSRLGVEVLRESRWLNAVSGRARLEVWEAVAALPFVQKLTVVRSGASSRAVPSAAAPGGAAGGTIDYGPSFDQLDEVNIVAAHASGLSGAGVRIAMLDTGFYQDHAAFAVPIANGQLIAQWDFVHGDGETQDEGNDAPGQHLHGTLTWSIVGGFDEGELVGAAYGAEFLLAKTEDATQEQPFEEDLWVEGMEWADANGADVISSSLGYKDWYSYEDLDGDTAVTTIGADIAASRGIVVCTAAGNEGTQDWYFIIAPADADSVLTVGGSTATGETWDQSSHGPTFDGRIKPEVVARASETYGAAAPEDHNGEGYRSFDGTSTATPIVAGAAALLLEAFPSWTPMMVREALMMTADNSESPDNDRGWGRIDVLGALSYTVSAPGDFALRRDLRLSVSPNPVTGPATISLRRGTDDAAGSDGRRGLLELFTASGRRVMSFPVTSLGRSLEWSALDDRHGRLAPGLYVLRWKAGEEEASVKVVYGR